MEVKISLHLVVRMILAQEVNFLQMAPYSLTATAAENTYEGDTNAPEDLIPRRKILQNKIHARSTLCNIPLGPISELIPAMQKPFPPFSERLIYYILLPDIFSRVFLEAGAGIYWYSITQPKQWVFYVFMLVEYALFLRTVSTVRFVRSVNIFAFCLFFLMFMHGLVAGILWGNGGPKIFTDSVPIFVLAANTLLLSSNKSFEGFDFSRAFTVARIYGVTMVVVGMVAVKMGRPSIVSLGGAAGTPLCLTLLVVGMAQRRAVSLLDFLTLLLIVVPIAPNITRTVLLAFIVSLVILLWRKVFVSAKTLYVTSMIVLAAVVITPMVIPPDSPIMRRINALFDDQASQTEGSLGERRAEFIAINEKLHALGSEAEFFGSGAGGIYKVEFSNGNVPENYSHAHFGWALFKLRYGYIGYVYLTLFGTLLIYNFLDNFSRRDPVGKTISVINFWGFIFIFTYMFFNQLIAGLQFCNPPMPEPRRKIAQSGSMRPSVTP